MKYFVILFTTGDEWEDGLGAVLVKASSKEKAKDSLHGTLPTVEGDDMMWSPFYTVVKIVEASTMEPTTVITEPVVR